MKKWIFIFFLGLLSMPCSIFGFTLSVTPTHETCNANGTLTFNPSATDPGGTINYLVYLLPNTTSPIASQTSTFLGSLSSGTYRVVAIETVGGTSTTQQVDVTINDNTAPLVYNVVALNQACSSISNIQINVTSGTGQTYEIISGPVTFPPQSSNSFSGLPTGVYTIRVFDICGNAVVTTHTVTLNPAAINIGTPTYTMTTPPSCFFTVATNILTPAPGTVLGYPLSIQYTVNPPGGGTPVIINSTVNSGNPTSEPVSVTIPSYGDNDYDYTISITDACGSTYSDNFPVTPTIRVVGTVIPISCNDNYFSLTVTDFIPPFTLNFTGSPAGFTPNTFNATYPGPYNSSVLTFGSSTNPVPHGVYQYTVTDACGRTALGSLPVLDLPPLPIGTGTNNGCLTNSGQIVVSIPNYEIVTAVITVAPAGYPFPLPHNVTASIDANHVLTLNPVPLGMYTFQLTDECGDIIPTVDVTVPVYVDQGLSSVLRPGCELNKSSVRINSENGRLNNITITSGPPGFAVPFNGNSNIASTDGIFYMNNLDPGTYVFSATDECNFVNQITVNVVGYSTTGSHTLQQNCGSFNIQMSYTDNVTANETFWLQKLLDPVTQTWGHPVTEVAYTNGTVPNSTNSRALVNNFNNLNFSFNGDFRVIHSFSSYNNGSELNGGTVTSIDRHCFEELTPILQFNERLEILGVNRMPCSNSGIPDIIVSAVGSPPLHYILVEQNGAPFFLDNGNSNIFSNLPIAAYVVRVEDSCGNGQNYPFNVANLQSLVTVTQPNDILECRTTITGSEVFDLTQQTPIILGGQSPTDFTLTYHTNITAAQDGTGALSGSSLTAFNPTSNPQTVYARVIFNQLPTCYEITSFALIVGQTPRLNLNPDYLNCSSAPVTLNASQGNLPTTTYLWSDGTVGPTITVSQIGVTNLTVTATNSYGSGGDCTFTRPVTVTISQPPVIDHIETVDWTDYDNSITIVSSNSSAFEYSLDGTNFQDENTFTNLISGLYTVTIRDKAGCGVIQKVIWLLNYPKYFTPNGDGINETWYIKNQQFEPDFTVEVYDRYGKLMKSFKSNTLGWDGTYNGAQNFSTDYWFVVHRQDGRVHKGHFSLKR